MYKKICTVMVAVILCGGCAGKGYGKYGEMGQYAWCNERYLYALKEQPVAHPKHLSFARRGYMYAVAGALVLQEENLEGKDYHFEIPSRLRQIDDHQPRGTYGFDVKAFDLFESPSSNNIKEVIIAFVGSNDPADWFWTNFLFSTEQHALARQYVKTIAQMRPGKRIVVTGYSLGGALAVHVTKDKDTRHLIAEAWAFNSSPKTWASGETDKRIWLGSAKGEILSSTRSVWFRWLPGINNIGAREEQTADDFYLIKTNGIYGHFRWVLPRSMLHFADYDLAPNNTPLTTEPLEILRQSHFEICRKLPPRTKNIVNESH